MPDLPAKRFRIAFSFAGEKRAFVAQVAELLAKEFGEEKILYDKYHEAEFAHADLAFTLPELYKEAADLIVCVLCPDYECREWCGVEWRVIFSIIKEGDAKRVMLSRFEKVDGQGLHGLGGFVDLDAKTPGQFATLILQRLALNEGGTERPDAKYAASSARVLRTDIPHNLPALQPFFGREVELRQIAEALHPASRRWGSLIDGPGGMGKTSLAVRAAYAASPEVFKKIVFVSLKTRDLDDDGVRDLSGFILSGITELFGELARELGHESILKADGSERPRLLLKALRGMQCLLILDNLENLLKEERDTLLTFVKKLPAGCKAILTSRGRIGSGAEELVLEKLSEEAALATLAALAMNNRWLAQTSVAERRMLYCETLGTPLLLCWAAGQMGRGHCVTFAHALHFLRSCPAGNDPLKFIFDDVVNEFDETATRVLCALAYFTLPAKAAHIAAIAGAEAGRAALSLLPDGAAGGAYAASGPPDGTMGMERAATSEDIECALRCMVNRSMAVPSDEFQTFTLVPMVADFLRKEKPEVIAETGRWLEQRAYALILENGGERHECFPVLEKEWPIIDAALPLLVTGLNDRLQTSTNALRAFFDHSGRWDEWFQLSCKAEKRALDEGDYANAGAQAYNVAWYYMRRQNAGLVKAHAIRAEKHSREAHDRGSDVARAIYMQGMGHHLAEEYAEAVELFHRALELHRDNHSVPFLISMCLNVLGKTERLRHDYAKADAYHQEAYEICALTNSPKGLCITRGNQADVRLACKDWQGAEALAREALLQAEHVHRKDLIAENNHRLAKALMRQGNAADALPFAQCAVDIFTRLGSPDLVSAQKTLRKCEDPAVEAWAEHSGV